MLGILAIDKPLGITSHDVVHRVRKALSERRVGHAGTLDPLATGVLVVAVGPATRFLQYLDLEPKVYEFSATFGGWTKTQDAETEPQDLVKLPPDWSDAIPEATREFSGEILQIPPMYSAVKREGKPLYLYARQGEEVDREPRRVYIHELKLIGVEGSVAHFRCSCSGGTYVRTLAHDLGQKLGYGAYLSALRRVAVGRFTLQDCANLENVAPEHLMPIRQALSPMPEVALPSEIEQRIREGQRIPIQPVPESRFVSMISVAGDVIGIASVRKGSLQPECVLPQT